MEIQVDPSSFLEMMPAQTFKLASPRGEICAPKDFTPTFIPECPMPMNGSRSKFVLRAWMHLSLSSVKARARIRVRECEKFHQDHSK